MIKATLSLATGAVLISLNAALAADFTVTSADAADGAFTDKNYADSFGCTGGNLSPQIAWSGAPVATKSFVVTIYDPEAPTGSGWWHWVVTNIPATANELPAGIGAGAQTLPTGAVQMNSDAGIPAYGGPCPPVGETHHYVITVTALGVEKLELPPNASGALVGYMTTANALAKATLTLTAGR
ncbi:YbhB/YbcL family Raf kinase inhibitor-like protein [Cypionkella psychrotolerans]|uniref:YbhB/YbcL family Raf kinase inhibitor-like protein n=1 Tax=Cypionkella psychrotolerans TaxID=1678131 RepID=UPI000A84D1D4|nr:YbhB/YbcL family Raf kinase inhibitor-like protein [Cypionkella psychrotolerans]